LLDVSPEQVRRYVRRALSDGLTEFNLQDAKRNARLSELSRRVINAAEQMAVSLDHHTVGLGHLLLMLALEPRSPTSALLRECGLDEARVRQGLDRRDPGLLLSVETVLERAFDRAQRMGSHYTGTEHLLLTVAQDEAGAALLRQYGVDPEDVCRRLERHLRA
jgi:ATP-dependent Clp protease ATP-binding subunit ClpC